MAIPQTIQRQQQEGYRVSVSKTATGPVKFPPGLHDGEMAGRKEGETERQI